LTECTRFLFLHSLSSRTFHSLPPCLPTPLLRPRRSLGLARPHPSDSVRRVMFRRRCTCLPAPMLYTLCRRSDGGSACIYTRIVKAGFTSSLAKLIHVSRILSPSLSLEFGVCADTCTSRKSSALRFSFLSLLLRLYFLRYLSPPPSEFPARPTPPYIHPDSSSWRELSAIPRSLR
jgi:hypothetical protein